MITPVPRRRPWQLAKVTTTLDLLSAGRVIIGVGIGSPAYGDFGIFHEPVGERERGGSLIRPSAADIADVAGRVTAARGSPDGFDLVVWAEVAPVPGEVADLAAPYQAAGATWWIETAKPEPGWWPGIQQRVAAGV